MARVRRHTELPVAVGFGVKTPEQAAAIARFADAVVVGSALVNRVAGRVADDGTAEPGLVDEVLSLVRDLDAGIRSAREDKSQRSAGHGG